MNSELHDLRAKTLSNIVETLSEITKLENAAQSMSEDDMVRRLREVSKANFRELTALDERIARSA